MEGRRCVIVDASTLINFLAVDRTDLLTGNDRYWFAITEHVRAEITKHYPDQLERLERLLNEGGLVEEPLTQIEELELYARLTTRVAGAPKSLGDGEGASIAAAVLRDCSLAIDDKTAIKRAFAIHKSLRITGTADLIVDAIRDGRISVEAADALKSQWASSHRFRLTFGSFGELLP